MHQWTVSHVPMNSITCTNERYHMHQWTVSHAPMNGITCANERCNIWKCNVWNAILQDPDDWLPGQQTLSKKSTNKYWSCSCMPNKPSHCSHQIWTLQCLTPWIAKPLICHIKTPPLQAPLQLPVPICRLLPTKLPGNFPHINEGLRTRVR